MIELIYPSEPATVVRGGKSGIASEMLPVVDENGYVRAQASRTYCHGGSKLLHPVVHLHIINRMGCLYLQKRGADKDLYPSRWDTAVGGHVSYGEYIREALFREAGEELGFYDFNPLNIESYVFESQREKELICVFAAVGNFELHPDNFEVSEGRWWSPGELEKTMGTGVFTPNFESEYARIKNALEALL